MRRHQPGFTLIEIMIVVAIVAILAAIAIPSYSNYVRRARIAEAVQTLSSMRIKMEQYFQDNRSYTGACSTSGSTVAPKPADTATFGFTCNVAAATYTVTATGVTTGPMANFTYTIDESNNRRTTALPSGWTGASATSVCWVLKSDGSC